MWRCPACGSSNDDGTIKCSACGKRRMESSVSSTVTAAQNSDKKNNRNNKQARSDESYLFDQLGDSWKRTTPKKQKNHTFLKALLCVILACTILFGATFGIYSFKPDL